MVGAEELAGCLATCAAQVLAELGSAQLAQLIEEPQALADKFEPQLRAALAARGVAPEEVSHHIRDNPCIHLKGVFDPAELPDTPLAWTPVPVMAATLLLQVAIILMSRIAGMETVSYKSENAGALFVNLVTLDGSGAMAEKSRGPMKGHTDAASFPFRGTSDPEDARIAPSPDVVFLAALRNPDSVPTIIMPLSCIVAGLTEAQVEVLKGERITLLAQRSFQRGTKAILGQEHLLEDSNILRESSEGTWVRYSHSNSVVDADDAEAADAKTSFETACLSCIQQVVLQPGDLLIVNNRKALHGRSPVGDAIGGASRWLVRSYALDTTGLALDQRYQDKPYALFP